MRIALKLTALQQLLARSVLSQNHWAIKLGISKGHLSDLLAGRHAYPSARTRERILDALGVPFEALFEVEPGADLPEYGVQRALHGLYAIDQEIGQGGMGTVYRARDLRLGRTLAIKIVNPEAVGGVGSKALIKEIINTNRLQHPNILSVLDAGEADGAPFYVMPYIRDGSLRDLLRRDERISVVRTLAILDGVADALDHAHALGVTHCDVKPGNILLASKHAYLIDFGIARVIQSEAWTSDRGGELDSSAGTPAYVSPEQARGDQDLDGRTDVYSLACMVYEMLSGAPPFRGETTLATVTRRLVGDPPNLRSVAPHLPSELAEAIQRAMAVDRNERTRTAGEFARECRRAVAAAGSVAGMPYQQAHGATSVTERLSDWLTGSRHAVAQGWRRLRSTPGYAAMTMATLGLGIGLTTAMFTLVERVLLRPLPFRESDRLVALSMLDSARNVVPVVSSADWFDWKSGNTTLTGAALYSIPRRIGVVAADSSARVTTQFVSAEFFDVLGARFAAGRPFSEADVKAHASVVVVSEQLWRRLFNGDPTLAKPLVIGDVQRTVIGVVANGAELPVGTEIWLPMQLTPSGGATRNNINYQAVARLKPGITAEQATADLSRVARGIRLAEPQALYSWGVDVKPLREIVVGNASDSLRLLSAAVALVLLIACANVATATLGRGAGRQAEMAIRASLGASRSRLVRQLLAEQLLLAVAGGVLGVLLAWGTLTVLVSAWGNQIPRAAEVRLDWVVLAFAAAATLLSGLLAGLVPAVRASRVSLSAVMNRGGRSSVRGGRQLIGPALVVTEFALAVVLLAGSGLLIRSFRALVGRDLGFDARVATVDVALMGPRYVGQPARRLAYWDALTAALQGAPGVEAVGLATWLPLTPAAMSFVQIQDRDAGREGAGYRAVSDDYFRAMAIPLVAGRSFNATDGPTSPRVAVVSREFAAKFWPGENALGKLVRSPSMEPAANGAEPPWLAVVGVVGDVRHYGFYAGRLPALYVLYRQVPMMTNSMSAAVRMTNPGGRALAALRERVHAVDPLLGVDVSTLAVTVERSVAPRRVTMVLLAGFAAVALFLAAIGIYGVLSYAVTQRSRELALRSALGARPGELLVMMLRGGMTTVAIGATIGMAAAFALSRTIRAMLVDVAPDDPASYAAALAVLGAAALAAVLVPSWRATRVDPMVVLKAE